MLLEIINDPYEDPYSVYNCIRYIMRDKSDKNNYHTNIYSGGYNIFDIKKAADEFFIIKNYYRKTDGRQIKHFVISPDPKDFFVSPMLYELALYICAYYSSRFQMVFSVHTDERSHPHIHFVVNTVSFVDGKKLHESKRDLIQLQLYCNKYYDYIKERYTWVSSELKKV